MWFKLVLVQLDHQDGGGCFNIPVVAADQNSKLLVENVEERC